MNLVLLLFTRTQHSQVTSREGGDTVGGVCYTVLTPFFTHRHFFAAVYDVSHHYL